MKREHPEMRNLAESGGSSAGLKAKIWEEEQGDGAMDELLAVLGYKVKQSDMADVAQKLEQLEMAMCRGSIDQNNQDGLLSYLSDTVHYNPSDISGWLESMLSEINPNPNFDPNPNPASSSSSVSAGQIDQAPNRVDPNPTHNSSTSLGIYEDNSEYDLRAIPGPAVAYPNKRIKSAPPVSGAAPPPEQPARPLLLVDSQETGVRLVHTLMACAEAVQNNNLKLADALVKQVGLLAVSQQGAMRKVATYFAEALARRIYRIYPNHLYSAVDSDILYMHFYESCPYLKFAHFTANQAILEAVSGSNRIHIIDFSMKQGLQWPALMQAFALQPGLRPAFRLTGIGPPQADNTDALQEVGWKLAQFAELLGIQFEYKGFVCDSLADLEPTMLDLRPSEVETLAVNSMFELHRLLARPGAAETVLRRIKAMQPKIVTLVEQEANHNGPVFLDRFNEALHYYSTMFDSLEGGSTQTGGSGSQQDVVMSEVFLGRQICNVVACEGADRVERHETLVQWRARMDSAGFDPVHLGSNAFKQASTLLERFAGRDGYRVEENNGCLMLDWHTRPLIATSAWRPATATSK